MPLYLPNETLGLDDPAKLTEYIRRELRRVSQALQETRELDLRPSFREPLRPRDGMIVYADGTEWNPGYGAGFYGRKNGLWIKLEGRERLTAQRNIYVSNNSSGGVQGSDTLNDGLTPSTPFLTIKHAIDFAAFNLEPANASGFVAINVADGTYNESILITRPFVGGLIVLVLSISGVPSQCIISNAGDCISAALPTLIDFRGFKLTSSGANCVSVNSGGIVRLRNIEFGTAGAAHMFADRLGTIEMGSDYTVSAGAQSHMQVADNSIIRNVSAAGSFNTATFTANMAFSTFVDAALLGNVQAIGWTGSLGGHTITGKRFSAVYNALIQTNSGDVNKFPGSVAGTTATGGNYQ